MGPALKTILLVEDDSGDARLLRRAFDKVGMNRTLVEVRNGDDAVSYLSGDGEYSDRQRHPPPEMILLDLKLPRRNGFEVLQWMRSGESQYRRTPVVVLSSSSESQDINRAYDLGANSYISKPHNTATMLELAETLKKYWLEIIRDPDLPGEGSAI